MMIPWRQLPCCKKRAKKKRSSFAASGRPTDERC
jgi:hypothetical protein